MTNSNFKELVNAIESTINIEDILEDLLNNVGEFAEPEDVFPEAKLTAWAEANGFVKED